MPKVNDASFAQPYIPVRQDGYAGGALVPMGLHFQQSVATVSVITLTPPPDAIALQLWTALICTYTLDGVTIPSATGTLKGMYLPASSMRDIRIVPGVAVQVATSAANCNVNYQWLTGV